MMHRLVGALALLLAAQWAYGFELVLRDDHALISSDELRALTLQIADASGHRIPDSPEIKVVVTARAKPRTHSNQFLYYHRVQLTKALSGDPPYPVRAWLPIKTIQYYGVAPAQEVRDELRKTLTEFFTVLKAVDPQTQAP